MLIIGIDAVSLVPLGNALLEALLPGREAELREARSKLEPGNEEVFLQIACFPLAAVALPLPGSDSGT